MTELTDSDERLREPPSDASRGEIDRFLEDVVTDFLLEREEGGDPDIDLILAQYPRYAEELARLLAHDDVPPPTAGRPATRSREKRRVFSRRVIGRYEILFHAAGTGSSDVYKARHQETGEEVALKVVRSRDAVDPRDLARFRREAKILSQLAHPTVLPLRDLGEDQGLLWMAIPWVDGVTLDEAGQILRGERRPGPVDPADLSFVARATIVARVANALADLHDVGILHRDLKPSNIMIDRRLEPVIIDFGIAKRIDDTVLTATADGPLGTPRYLAPELISARAGSADARTEVYGLGLILWELLTGRRAFPMDDRQQLFDAIARGLERAPRGVDSRIPRRLSDIVQRAVSREPSRRPSDPRTLAVELDAWVRRQREVARLRPYLSLIGLALVVFAALAAWLVLRGS